MNSRFDDFLFRLAATQSVLDTWNETVSFQASLGFELTEYGYAAAGTGGLPAGVEIATLSNFPAAYRDRYRRERYYRDDPVVHHCLDSLSPQLVGRDFLDLWDRGRSLTPLQRRIVDEAAACGMKVGMVIPLRSAGRYPLAGMSLSNAMRPNEFRRVITEWGHVAHLAALYAHNHLQMLLQTPEEEGCCVVLSPRERECLLWVSHGLSSKQTAERIGRSSKTVDFYVASAMNKLGAATRAQAVLRAVTLGLLEP